MRHRGIGATGILIALVVGVLLACSGAQAAEFGRCVETASGEYADAGCNNQAAQPKGGGFEWELPPKSFHVAFGETRGENKEGVLICTGGTAAGTFAGFETGLVTDMFTGCSAGGHVCTSFNAAKEGEIKTFALEFFLIEHGEKTGLSKLEPLAGEVWIEYVNRGAEAPIVWDGHCAGLGYDKVTNWVSTKAEPVNVMSGGATENFGSGHGEEFDLLGTFCEDVGFTKCFYTNVETNFVGKAVTEPLEAPKVELRDGEPPAAPPEAATEEASEVTTESATVNGYVVPNGEPVTECVFEYGPSEEGLHESAPCSPLPGEGHTREAVSASLVGLSKDSAIVFRVSAKTKLGTSHGAWNTFTTLETIATGEVAHENETALAVDGPLEAQASGGTGRIVVGTYGEEIGGTALALGRGSYFQVYHSARATFKKVVYKDCELDGASTVWWDNTETGWEPIREPTAVYSESPKPCVTITVTAHTTPSIAQLSDPRHVGGPSAYEEYGQCVPAKKAKWSEKKCVSSGIVKNKQKGKWEWLPAPVACFAMKPGRYSSSTCTKEKLGKHGELKGKYELGESKFTGSGGALRVQGTGVPTLTCTESTSEGSLRGPNFRATTLIFTGCEAGNTPCASAGQQADSTTIESEALESYTYEEATEKYLAVLAGNGTHPEGTELAKHGAPIMRFTCGNATYTLSGAMAGPDAVTANTPGTTMSKATFEGALGAQELEVEVSKGVWHEVTLSTVISTVDKQPNELRDRKAPVTG